ncbi:MAG: hypothetical protein ISS15_07415 [Alphaproteobacteria bacterium]|nr:hypothetical protein [Alphaproteobacteria bacterium]MBL7097468.1 hypothetical protein [Alphaproteobacteria bacterium]
MLSAAALLLLVATVASWLVGAAARPAARVQLRFAAVLFVACGAAAIGIPAAAPAVVLLVIPIATAILAVAAQTGFDHPLTPALSSLVLALASLCGIAGAVGFVFFALAASVPATGVLFLVSLRRAKEARIAAVQCGIAALCLIAAQSLFVLEGVDVPFLLFLSAGLLGVTLALSRSDPVIEQKAIADLRGAAIGRH